MNAYWILCKSICSWLGKWFLFQTYEELDNVKDKSAEVKEIYKFLNEYIKGGYEKCLLL